MNEYDLVLLLGGTGSRMVDKPLGNKHLIEINGKSNVELIKEKIQKYEESIQPFANKYVVTNGKGVEEIMNTLGQDYKYFFQEKPTGIPDAAYLPNPKNPFLLHLGDQFYTDNVGKFIEGFKESGEDMRVWLKETNDHNHTVALLDGDGNLKRFVEKPQYPSEMKAHVATGMYMLQPYLKSFIKDLPRHYKGENNMADLSNKVLSEGYKIGTKSMAGHWADVNSQEFKKMVENYK